MEFEKIVKQSGNVFALDLQKISDTAEAKKTLLKEHFEDNKDALKDALPHLQEYLEQIKYDLNFYAVLKTTKSTIRHLMVNDSGSEGVEDWSCPSDSLISWDNPLATIEFNN